MKSLTSTIVLSALAMLLLLSTAEGQGLISPIDYDIYVGERATPFIAYAPPEVDLNMATIEPRQLHRLDVPRALCGITVLKPDLLMTSLRCAPSVAAKATLYLLEHHQTTDNIFLKVPDAKTIRNAVTSIAFKPQYTLEGTQDVYTNIALLQLKEPMFKA